MYCVHFIISSNFGCFNLLLPDKRWGSVAGELQCFVVLTERV